LAQAHGAQSWSQGAWEGSVSWRFDDMGSLLKRFLVHVVLLSGILRVATFKFNIPTFENVGQINLEQFIELTDHMSKPAIIKGFFDPSLFEEACRCDNNNTFYDNIDLPLSSKGGNSKDAEWSAQIGGSLPEKAIKINGGTFVRDRACAEQDDYIFFDLGSGLRLTHLRFFEQMRKMLNVSEAISDPSYTDWMHEMFIGYSSKQYPVPTRNTSGSLPHRAPVVNYYYQICGKKKWHIGDWQMDVGKDYDGSYYMLPDPENKAARAYLEREDLYQGYTEPGDVLINPPWLWHCVLAAKGFNFAIAFKQVQFAEWRIIYELDPLKASHFYKYHQMREKKEIPYRPYQERVINGTTTMKLPGFDVFDWLKLIKKAANAVGALAVSCSAWYMRHVCLRRSAKKAE